MTCSFNPATRRPGLGFLVAASILLAGLTGCATVNQPLVSGGPSGDIRGFTRTGIYLSARFADATSDAQTASELLTQVLVDNPDNLPALQRTLFQALSAGRMDLALKTATELVKQRPGQGLAELTLAIDDLRNGRFGLADAKLAQVNEGPTQFVAPLLRAWISTADGRVDDALQLLDQVESQGRLAQLGRAHRAMILDAGGRYYDARNAYAANVKDGTTTLRYVEIYGNFLTRTNQIDMARDLYNKTLEVIPDYQPVQQALARLDGPKPDPIITSGAVGAGITLYDIGSALSQESARDLAVVYLRLAAAADPASTQITLALGDTLIHVNRESEGVALLEAIDKSSINYMQAQLSIAGALSASGQFADAEEHLTRLAVTLPDKASPYATLGDMLREREEYARAVVAYDAAFARIAQPQKRHWRLYFARGACLERLDRWEQAQADLELALALNPDEPTVLNYLGYSWLDRGLEAKRARSLIERAAEAQPNDGYIIDSLGWSYFRGGDIKLAVPTLERAVQLKPQDSTINEHLGDAYWRAGRKLEARFQWNHALSFKPEKDQETLLHKKLELGLDLAEKAKTAQRAMP